MKKIPFLVKWAGRQIHLEPTGIRWGKGQVGSVPELACLVLRLCLWVMGCGSET